MVFVTEKEVVLAVDPGDGAIMSKSYSVESWDEEYINPIAEHIRAVIDRLNNNGVSTTIRVTSEPNDADAVAYTKMITSLMGMIPISETQTKLS